MKRFTRTVLAAMWIAGLAAPAAAGTDPTRDHLQCYKVSDPSRYFAVLNLDAGFEAEAVGIADSAGCYASSGR